jgi:NADH-quinone oxidoreductase subunit M
VVYFAPLVILAFWIGIYPKPFFRILDQPVTQLVRTIRPDYPLPQRERLVEAASQQPRPGTPAASQAAGTKPGETR